METTIVRVHINNTAIHTIITSDLISIPMQKASLMLRLFHLYNMSPVAYMLLNIFISASTLRYYATPNYVLIENVGVALGRYY